jgi:hypothetical protein
MWKKKKKTLPTVDTTIGVAEQTAQGFQDGE